MRFLLKLIANFFILLFWGARSLLLVRRKKPSRRDYVRIRIKGALPWVNVMESWLAYFRKPPMSIEELAEDVLSVAHSPARGVIFEIYPLSASYDRIEAVRSLVALLRERGKETVALLIARGNREYLLASACDRVVAVPGTGLMLFGVGAEATYFRAALDKLGVVAQFYQAGRYKSAGEMFTNKAPSPEAEEELTEILKGIYDFFVKGVASGRKMDEQRMRELLDASPIGLERALKDNLIDDLAPIDDIGEAIGGRLGKKPRIRSLSQYLSSQPRAPRFYPLVVPKRLAVLRLKGMILEGADDRSLEQTSVISLSTTIRLINEIKEDKKIAGVVVWITSPGGSALVSEVIYDKLRNLGKEKPTVAFMDGVAASGGYFIASGCNYIVSGETTVTGSIGVIVGKLAFGGLAEKLGVSYHRFSGGGITDYQSVFEPMDERTVSLLTGEVGEIYRNFVKRVAEGRRKEMSEVERVAEGRVWLGAKAREIGLVDEIGTFRTALDRAAGYASLSPQAIDDVEFFAPAPRLQSLFMGAPGDCLSAGEHSPLAIYRLMETLNRERVLMLSPYAFYIFD
ncbi:MAG: signal peptide peptidase SppA [Myxococcota bacterium]